MLFNKDGKPVDIKDMPPVANDERVDVVRIRKGGAEKPPPVRPGLAVHRELVNAHEPRTPDQTADSTESNQPDRRVRPRLGTDAWNLASAEPR